MFRQNLELGMEDGAAQHLFQYFRLSNASIKLDEHMVKKQNVGNEFPKESLHKSKAFAEKKQNER